MAGDQAEHLFAHAEAEHQYRRALELVRESGATSIVAARLEAEVMGKLGDVLHTVARYDEALQILERAVDMYRAVGNLRGLAGTLAKVGQTHAFRGTPEEGAERIQQLLGPLEEQGPSADLASLYVQMARLFFFSGKYDQQQAAAQRAVDVAAMVESTEILIEAWTFYGHATALLGCTQEGGSALERALQLAEATTNAPIHVQCLILGALAMMRLVEGQFGPARSYAQRAVEASERLGDPTMIAIWKAACGLRAFFVGDWHEARVNYEHGVELNRSIGPHSTSPYPLFCLGWLYLAEGAWDRAAQVLDESLSAAQRTGNLQALRWTAGIQAELDLLEGRAAVALSRLIPLLDRPGLQEWDVDLLLPRVAWAHFELGDVVAAEAEAARAIERSRSRGEQIPLIGALRVHGLAAWQRGRRIEARSDLEEALLLTKRLPYPYAEAHVLRELGMLHCEESDRRRARERLQEALSIFRGLGAWKEVEQTEQALTKLEASGPRER
jgi:tetratricopeptide (TPR) repeat protein